MEGSYYLLYDIIREFVYGADAVLTSEQVLTLTLFSTAGSLFCIVLPFVMVFWCLRKFFG